MIINDIIKLLKERFSDADIEISDNKHDGRHLTLQISSSLFKGKETIECHRMVYAVLKHLLLNNTIHALELITKEL